MSKLESTSVSLRNAALGAGIVTGAAAAIGGTAYGVVKWTQPAREENGG